MKLLKGFRKSCGRKETEASATQGKELISFVHCCRRLIRDLTYSWDSSDFVLNRRP